MKHKWENRGDSLGSFRCVTLATENEKTLSGELGEIWEYSPTHYAAYKILPTKSEKLFRFEKAQLAKWILALRVPSDPEAQAAYANSR